MGFATKHPLRRNGWNDMGLATHESLVTYVLSNWYVVVKASCKARKMCCCVMSNWSTTTCNRIRKSSRNLQVYVENFHLIVVIVLIFMIRILQLDLNQVQYYIMLGISYLVVRQCA